MIFKQQKNFKILVFSFETKQFNENVIEYLIFIYFKNDINKYKLYKLSYMSETMIFILRLKK